MCRRVSSPPPPPDFLPGWSYRKQITINGSSAGAQTNYQMKLNVYKGTGTDSGNSVYLNNYSRDDFADIRFTKADGTTLLDHWRESYTPGSSAVFWIEFDSIPASPSTATFYIYYGNSGATSASNGANTFVFFDDFDDGVFDTTTRWTVVSGNTPTESGGRVHLIGETYPSYSLIQSSITFQYHKVRARVNYASSEGAQSWQSVPAFANSYVAEFYRNTDSPNFTIGAYTNNSSGYQDELIGTGFVGSFHTYEIQRLSSSVKYYIDDILRTTHSTYVPTENEYLQLRMWYSTAQTDMDWIAVLNNATVEPTWGAWGSEIIGQASGYKAPEASWKYATYAYDALGRVTTQTNADGTSTSNDYSTAWQTLVTNERGYKKRYYYDAFQRLVKVEELNASQQVYATTEYDYDVLSNLTQVTDANSNNTTMTYDWLSRKTAMTDPDMGSWSYGYDNNSNLQTQTDAKGQTITFTYDTLNRLTGKTYPQGSGMTNVTYTYDNTTGDNFGKGQRTGMTDALGTTSYKYDNRGRLVEEKRAVDSVNYITQFTYDGADRLATITYHTGEVVTNGYNARGLPYSLSGSLVGNLVTSTLYNNLSEVTEINLGNGLRTTFGYWDVGGAYDTTGGYYGRLWEIKTAKQPGGSPVLQDVKHTWDAGGNLAQREDVLAVQTETFSYDFLDRLKGVSGPYSENYTYNQIGNIMTKNGVSYDYGSKPHAVTSVGSTTYTYDANGNMQVRGSQTLTWDAENRPVSVTDNGTTSTFVYDGDGQRVKKTEGGQTILYINRYYEKNLTSGDVTTYYYLGERLVAMRQGTTLTYVHQDHLTGTAVVSDSSGALVSSIKYFPFGECRNSQGNPGTDKLFTGQRLDGTGLYYYGARYYDASIGRFVSADIIVQNPNNPQALNRYSYCLNNPLAYIDPTGHIVEFYDPCIDVYALAAAQGMALPESGLADFFALLDAWNLLSSGPASALTQMLENAKETITIEWYTMEMTGWLVPGDTNRWGTLDYIIRINDSRKGEDIRLIACDIVHEAFAAATRLGNTLWAYNSFAEEAFSYSLQYAVGLKLGITLGGLPAACKDVNPWLSSTQLDTALAQAIDALRAGGYDYLGLLWPKTGRDEFLLNAQSVWPGWSYFDLYWFC